MTVPYAVFYIGVACAGLVLAGLLIGLLNLIGWITDYLHDRRAYYRAYLREHNNT